MRKKIHPATDKTRSQYFQTIARHFFLYRGAPFFLSSKDFDLITRWEKMSIPLHVVLEGMSMAFEGYRPGKKQRGKVFSLSFCQHSVARAFEQYKERRVGKRKTPSHWEEKRRKARTEVKKFLKTLPAEAGFLKEAYSRAYELLSQTPVEEEELERLEEKIEGLLFRSFPFEKPKDEQDAKDETGPTSFQKIEWVKRIREKYRIPYISLFYY